MKAWKQVFYKIWVSDTNLVTMFRRHKMMNVWTSVITVRKARKEPQETHFESKNDRASCEREKGITVLLRGSQDTDGFLKGNRKREPPGGHGMYLQLWGCGVR